MERWGIDVAKEYFKFSSAHFLIFPDGTRERLHGHNYRVYVEVDAGLGEHGLVIDFKQIKPIVRDLVDSLDEYWLVPGEHQFLRVEQRADGVTEVTYEGETWTAPTGDVVILPINNTSSENLAGWLGRELLAELGRQFPGVCPNRLKVAVEETSGQRGIYEFVNED